MCVWWIANVCIPGTFYIKDELMNCMFNYDVYRTNKHTILYTDDPGELAEDPEAPKEEPDDKEAPKKEKDIPEDEESNDVTMETGCQSPEWKDGLRTLVSIYVIK